MPRVLDPSTLIKPKRFAHFVLRTRDLEESIRFYEILVGMEVVHRSEMLAFLSYDHEHHRLALLQTPQSEPAPPGAAGLDHVAYTLEDLGQLLATHRRLRAEGIEPVWAINHGPTTSLYYRDPDGNRVELQIDNFETEAELKGWMKSEAFAANPIGVVFDPEKLAARYEQGDPVEELLQQGAA